MRIRGEGRLSTPGRDIACESCEKHLGRRVLHRRDRQDPFPAVSGR